MIGEERRVGVQVDVGPVGHVEAEALHLVEHRELVAEEVGGALRPGLWVGPVEGDGARPVGEVLPAAGLHAVVQRVAPPEVVGLPGGDAVLQHVGGRRGVVAHAQRDVLLLARVADQLQEVHARRPGLVDAQRHGGLPGARNRADGAAEEHRGCLALAADLLGAGDQPAAEALVVAHAIGLDVEGGGGGVDEQVEFVARDGADGAGVALEHVGRLDAGDHPVDGAGLGVLGDQPGRHRGGHTAGEDRRCDGGAGAGAPGLGRAARGGCCLAAHSAGGGGGNAGEPEQRPLQKGAPVEPLDRFDTASARRTRHFVVAFGHSAQRILGVGLFS